MEFFIQQWPDQSATLMLADGTSVNTYHTVNEAQAVLRQWREIHSKSESGHIDTSALPLSYLS